MSDRAQRAMACGIMATLLVGETARGQWPPWLAREESPPVYPSLVLPCDSVESGGWVVLDARTEQAWAGGHVPGAIPAPPERIEGADPAAARPGS